MNNTVALQSKINGKRVVFSIVGDTATLTTVYADGTSETPETMTVPQARNEYRAKVNMMSYTPCAVP